MVGTIDAVGAGVDAARVGQRVIVFPAVYGDRHGSHDDITTCQYVGSELDGGFAQYCVVPQENAMLVRHCPLPIFSLAVCLFCVCFCGACHTVLSLCMVQVPDECPYTDIELASFATAYMTAYHMVRRAKVANTDTVVVTGASGGVGVALVQLCKAQGARVVAVAGKAKAGTVRDIGADVVVHRPAGDDMKQFEAGLFACSARDFRFTAPPPAGLLFHFQSYRKLCRASKKAAMEPVWCWTTWLGPC